MMSCDRASSSRVLWIACSSRSATQPCSRRSFRRSVQTDCRVLLRLPRGIVAMYTDLANAPGAGARSAFMSHETPVVFVVDDDISVRESLELLIRSAGWLPDTCESASEFLSRPRALVPNCLILDVNL